RKVEQTAAGASDAGARVEERLPALDWDALDGLYGDLIGAITGAFTPGASLSDEQRSLSWYLEALDRRDRAGAVRQAFFDGGDPPPLPPATPTAFTPRESGAPLDVDGTAASYWAAGRLVGFANFAGLPTLVVPAGTADDGLPAGVQIAGPPWSELRL